MSYLGEPAVPRFSFGPPFLSLPRRRAILREWLLFFTLNSSPSSSNSSPKLSTPDPPRGAWTAALVSLGEQREREKKFVPNSHFNFLRLHNYFIHNVYEGLRTRVVFKPHRIYHPPPPPPPPKFVKCELLKISDFQIFGHMLHMGCTFFYFTFVQF